MTASGSERDVRNPSTREGYRRVVLALRGVPPDRVPRGELKLPVELVKGITGRKEFPSPQDAYRAEEEALRILGSDMTSVVLTGRGDPGEFESWAEELSFWAGRSFFVWVIVDGPFHGLLSAMGWQAVFGMLGRKARSGDTTARPMGEFLSRQTGRIVRLIQTAVARGADGILLGEDVGFYGGLLVSPDFLRTELVPRWTELTSLAKTLRTTSGEVPLVAFHSDGRIQPILDDLLSCGFDAVHSLEPEAGMDVAALLAKYYGKMGLMGGISVDRMVRDVERLCEEAARLACLARNGGLVIGSAAGILPGEVPACNVIRVYRAVR